MKVEPHATLHVDALIHAFTRFCRPLGAAPRLARLLAVTELHSWSVSQDLTERAGRLRVEVSDARGDLRPLAFPAGTEVDLLSTSGRGLALVAALADHGDCVPHPPSGR